MAIKNLMEDIVHNVVNEIIKNDKSILDDSFYITQIVAYVLNRVPPRYITSERGILHGVLSAKLETQQKTDIFMLTYEALEVFKKRRSSVEGELVQDPPLNTDFPHIIGQVLEETTFSVIPDVNITMYYKGEVVKMVDPDWRNPYVTNTGTRGYFHFWPDLDISNGDNGEACEFSIMFTHNKCVTKEVDIQVECNGSVGIGMSYSVPIVLLSLKEGVDLKEVIS